MQNWLSLKIKQIYSFAFPFEKNDIDNICTELCDARFKPWTHNYVAIVVMWLWCIQKTDTVFKQYSTLLYMQSFFVLFFKYFLLYYIIF